MSTPSDSQPTTRRRRPRAVGTAVAAAVLAGVTVVWALVWALSPGGATASASLTVTPRSADGADAALMLADRYTVLAGSPDTVRAARERDPALAGVPLDRLEDGTQAERSATGATITVRVTLPDAGQAAAAANAVVDTLVADGADEELVDVAPGSPASADRADSGAGPLPWVVGGLLLALAAGTAAALATRTPGRHRAPATPPLPAAAPDPGTAFPHDDLPGFLETPPGSPVPATVAATETATAATEPVQAAANGHRATAPGPLGRRFTTAAAAAALVLSLVALAVAVGRDRSGAATSSAFPSAAFPTAAPTPSTPAPSAAPPSATGGTAAGDLAFTSVPLGEDGVAASVVFEGVLFEQRAVGLTVTYPAVSVTTDGEHALAHVRFPTFNCLTEEPPADPVAAGCARSITEYADLAGPELQVTRDAGRIELAGRFATYTRPNGSAPAYTGRTYQLSASVTATDPDRSGEAPATGVVRLGLDSAPTAPGRGVNLLQFPG